MTNRREESSPHPPDLALGDLDDSRAEDLADRSELDGLEFKDLQLDALSLRGAVIRESRFRGITSPDVDLRGAALRRGEVELGDVIDSIERADRRLVSLGEASTVPDQPDRGWVDAWLHRSHLAYWHDSPPALPTQHAVTVLSLVTLPSSSG